MDSYKSEYKYTVKSGPTPGSPDVRGMKEGLAEEQRSWRQTEVRVLASAHALCPCTSPALVFQRSKGTTEEEETSS